MKNSLHFFCSALIISALCVSCGISRQRIEKSGETATEVKTSRSSDLGQGASQIEDSVMPQVWASMWLRVSDADSVMAGYRTIEAEGQTRHIVPITEWTAAPEVDTYHRLHHHGVAIESDKMAYRIYFDKKQTIDVYAKKTPRLELGTSYWYPNDEQLAQGYGDDILRVSGTVGVGSVKAWKNGKMVHIEPVESRTERIAEVSKEKAAMEITVKGWQTEGKSVDMTVRYTIGAHRRDMLCEVFLSEALDSLCTGVQLIPNKGRKDIPMLADGQRTYQDEQEYIDTTDGILLGSWGTDWPVNDTIKYGKETAGLGVFVPKEYAKTAVHDKRNNLAQFAGKTYLRFYLTVVSLKENMPPASDAEAFYRYLQGWREEIQREENGNTL